MSISRNDVPEKIFSILRSYSPPGFIGLNEHIGKDVGITGGDAIQLLSEIEETFQVDLTPLVDRSTIREAPGWFDLLLGRKEGTRITDFTVGDLVEYISSNLFR